MNIMLTWAFLIGNLPVIPKLQFFNQGGAYKTIICRLLSDTKKNHLPLLFFSAMY